MNHNSFFKSIKSSLKRIGDALRDLNESTDTYSFSQFADAILSGKENTYQKGYDEGVNFLSNSVAAVSIGQSYTAPHDGFIVFKASASVTNHDNSYEMDASIVAYYNRTVYKRASDHIDAWGGGSMAIEGTIKVSKGDTFSCSINVSNDKSINWTTTYTGVYFNTSVN